MMQKKGKKEAAKPVIPEVKPKPNVKIVNASEKLAMLLRKESMLTVKVRKAQTELRAAQTEIAKLWAERQEQTLELLKNDAER